MREEAVELTGRERASSCRCSSFPTRSTETDSLGPWNRTWRGTNRETARMHGEKELQESENGGSLG